MRFADEIRAQAKTKETLAQEEARRQREWEESARKMAVQEYEKVSSAVKARISDAAKKGLYRQEGSGKIIEETFLLFEHRNMDYVFLCTNNFLEHAGIEEAWELIRTRKRIFQTFPLQLYHVSLRAKYSWCESVLTGFLDGLRKDGIDASFQIKWLLGGWMSPAFNAQGKEYVFSLKEAVIGYQFEQWFDERMIKYGKADSCTDRKRLCCTYRFRF